MQIKLRVLRAIQNAVQSITDCTSPVIEVAGIRAAADGLRSPYVSHKTVRWEVCETRPGEMIASSSRYSMAVQTIYGPDDPPSDETLMGFVGTWEGGYVPVRVVRPVLDLAESLGLELESAGDEIVRAYVLLPKLADFHCGRPVFWLADKNNGPIDITEYVHDDPVARIGGVSIVRRDAATWRDKYWLLSLVPMWEVDDRMGPVLRDDAGRDDFWHAGAVPVVAARYRGETVFLARVDGPAVLITSEERVDLGDDLYLAIMPAEQVELARV